MLRSILCLFVVMLVVQAAVPNPEICNIPSETGRCKAAFRRFYFNPNTGRCEKFIYGGCGGNENNFKTKDECEKVCGGKGSGIRPSVGNCPEMVCSKRCKNGYKYDIEGCKTCECKQSDVIIPRPWPCPMYRCSVYCVNGYKTDSRGCTTCSCISPISPIGQGRCPRNSKSNIGCPQTSTDSCTTDNDCPRRKKCCHFGCSKKCIKPLRSYRWYF